ERDAAARAGRLLGERAVAFALDRGRHLALADPQRGLDRLVQPAANARLDHDAVDHGLDVVLLALVEMGQALRLDDLAVDAQARPAGPASVLEQLAMLALAVDEERREQDDALAFGQTLEGPRDLLGALALDAVAA